MFSVIIIVSGGFVATVNKEDFHILRMEVVESS